MTLAFDLDIWHSSSPDTV